MRRYTTIQGRIVYPDRASFDRVIYQLQEGGWMDKEGYILDTTDNRISSDPRPDAKLATLFLDIPRSMYRNLSYVHLFGAGCRGCVTYTSTDGVFLGMVESDVEPKRFVVSLEQYAVNAEPDWEKDFKAFQRWQGRAEEAFHDEYHLKFGYALLPLP